ncbi:MAG: hypothetical protein IPO07_07615 [Haliscomenobacter sp.]|nr:hypothetical protein [Haliscomenobacter sp.]MBK9488663.1 hypothetical protein [Haliscomenobacter sp.]
MRNTILFYSLIALLAACNSPAPKPDEDTLVNADFTPLEIDLESLLQEGKLPKDTLITIAYDHFFKQKKRFKAYPPGGHPQAIAGSDKGHQ